jgi:hypothetical protein
MSTLRLEVLVTDSPEKIRGFMVSFSSPLPRARLIADYAQEKLLLRHVWSVVEDDRCYQCTYWIRNRNVVPPRNLAGD